MQVIGTPTSTEIKAMNKDFKDSDLPKIDPLPLEDLFPPTTSPVALDFLKSIFVYDPNKRPQAI